MELFLDTEFTGLRQNAELISLALVGADDRWFYAEFTDFDREELSDWHREYVLPYLFLEKRERPDFASGQGTTFQGEREEVSRRLRQWLAGYERVEIWADAPAFDWVFFCELFGGALYLPENIFYLPFDLTTLLKLRGLNPDADRELLAPGWVAAHRGPKHNALFDAFLTREICRQLGNPADRNFDFLGEIEKK